MDYQPNQILHAIRLGLKELALNNKTIWLCASCETCTTRCPQEIDLVKVMDTLRSITLKLKIKPKIPDIASFYQIALSNIRSFGRMYELALIGKLKLATGKFTKDLTLGLKMFRKGKLKIFPRIIGFLTVKRIFSKVKKKEK
jgi:heterodisulfide reductase subunit C